MAVTGGAAYPITPEEAVHGIAVFEANGASTGRGPGEHAVTLDMMGGQR